MTNRFTLGQHKAIFTLELQDGRELLLTVPPLSVFKRMTAMQGSAGVDEMIDIVCDILNSNRTGATFTPKEVAGLFAFDDLVGFFAAYSDFVEGATKAKNRPSRTIPMTVMVRDATTRSRQSASIWWHSMPT